VTRLYRYEGWVVSTHFCYVQNQIILQTIVILKTRNTQNKQLLSDLLQLASEVFHLTQLEDKW